jgi:hypothetical protein
MINVTTVEQLSATADRPDDGLCETEACRVPVEEGFEIWPVESGTAQKAVPNIVFVYIKQTNEDQL